MVERKRGVICLQRPETNLGSNHLNLQIENIEEASESSQDETEHHHQSAKMNFLTPKEKKFIIHSNHHSIKSSKLKFMIKEKLRKVSNVASLKAKMNLSRMRNRKMTQERAFKSLSPHFNSRKLPNLKTSQRNSGRVNKNKQ